LLPAFLVILLTDLKSAYNLRFLIPAGVLSRIFFGGSFQYFLEILDQNPEAMEQNIQKGFFISRSQNLILNPSQYFAY